eukprot:4998742-Pleurochrysis_carterae.AAC.1
MLGQQFSMYVLCASDRGLKKRCERDAHSRLERCFRKCRADCCAWQMTPSPRSCASSAGAAASRRLSTRSRSSSAA